MASPSPVRSGLRACAVCLPLACVSFASAAAPGPVARDSAPSSRADARALADRVAARYGLARFARIQSIRFTFHVRRDGKDTAREWTWFPGNDSVIFAGKDRKGLGIQASYDRKNRWSLSSGTVAGIDTCFAQDQFWLLFPLHLAWDGGLDLERAGDTLTVRYPEDGGPTPGASYDLVVAADGTLRSWTVRPGGGDSLPMRSDWAPPKDVDGLPLSLERTGPKGFKVWFTHVKVTGLQPD